MNNADETCRLLSCADVGMYSAAVQQQQRAHDEVTTKADRLLSDFDMDVTAPVPDSHWTNTGLLSLCSFCHFVFLRQILAMILSSVWHKLPIAEASNLL